MSSQPLRNNDKSLEPFTCVSPILGLTSLLRFHRLNDPLHIFYIIAGDIEAMCYVT